MAVRGGEPKSHHTELCDAIIADYAGKTRNIGRYSLLWRTEKPPQISAIAPRRCGDLITLNQRIWIIMAMLLEARQNPLPSITNH